MNSLHVELTSADMKHALEQIDQLGIVLADVQITTAYTIRFHISGKDWDQLEKVCIKNGDSVQILSRKGIKRRIQSAAAHPILVVGITLLVMLSMWLPGRVLFIEVEGNQSIEDKQIIEAAARCGINFGASSRAVRSEKMKNSLIAEIPNLQWAGVNTYGCTAVISVKERSEQETEKTESSIGHIVASRDGVIRSVTVLRGSALCVPGQAVKAGQMLISGYTDCGIFLQATQAEGEILAETKRSVVVLSPCERAQRKRETQVKRNFALKIGKKRINFYNSSGILDTTCAKIYKQKYITLPGGFVLPISVICEQWICYESVQTCLEPKEQDLAAFSQTYLRDLMKGGEILSATESCKITDDCAVLQGIYSCREMIGLIYPEEIDIEYEND